MHDLTAYPPDKNVPVRPAEGARLVCKYSLESDDPSDFAVPYTGFLLDGRMLSVWMPSVVDGHAVLRLTPPVPD